MYNLQGIRCAYITKMGSSCKFLFHLGLNCILLVVSSTSVLPKRDQIPTPPQMLLQPAAGLLPYQQANWTAFGAYEKHKPFLLLCEATGTPPLKYQWYKNGMVFDFQEHHPRISQRSGQGTLVVTKPMDVDEGHYYCTATNEFGTSVSNGVMVNEAVLEDFPDTADQTVVAMEGHPLSVPCIPPKSFPKPTILWILESEPGGAMWSINSSRITVDPEGTLHFTNVTAADGLDDRSYVCTAAHGFRNMYKSGNRFKLHVVTPARKRILPLLSPTEQYISPLNITSMRGETQEIHCIFGGIPRPEISWRKKNGTLDPGRYTTINYGKTLKLKKVDFQDEGTYECTASNGVGRSVSQDVSITVQAIPYWVTAPKSTIAAVEDTVRFECKASGVPEPHVQWFINSVPIEKASPNPRRKLVSPNIMVIEKLENTDTAVFQCNASNKFGYAFRDFYLNVNDMAPSIIEPPVKLYETVEGHNVTFRCRVIGAPRPQVSWLRGGKELVGGKHTILDNGDLEIAEVKFADAGRYKCIASNKLGNDSSDDSLGHLDVKERTVMKDFPADYEARADGTAIFGCNAVADFTLDLEIEWLKNGQLIDFEGNTRMYKLKHDSSLVITKIREEDYGIYTCVAKTRLDNVTASANLIVPGYKGVVQKSPAQDEPNIPKLVGVMCRKHRAVVEWHPMVEQREPILYFTVEYNTSFTPDTWEADPNHIPADDLSLRVLLSPWTNYTFRVIAVNKDGRSLPSGHSEPCETPPDVPYQNPENVEGKGYSPDNLVISWTAMPQIEHNAPGFFYRVFWKRQDSDDGWMMEDIHDWQQTRFVVSNTPAYTPYTIKVEAHNSRGQAYTPARQVTGYSGEIIPLEAPRNLTLVRIIDGNTAELSWDSVRGSFEGYKIQSWTPEVGMQGLREIVLPVNVTRSQVSMFFTLSENHARVLAFNGKEDGPPSEVLRFHTPEGTPGPVTAFKALPLGAGGLKLMWKEPVDHYGVLTGYRIYYQELRGMTLGPRMDMEPHIEDASATSATLTSLKPDTKYRVTVTATTAQGLGVPYSIEKMTRSKSEGQTSSSEVEEVTTSVTDYRVKWGHGTTFSCNSLVDNSLDLEIECFVKGQLIDFKEDPGMNTTYDSALVINKTNELDSSLYTCVAKTRLDNVTSATPTSQDVPNAPKLVGVKCGKTTALVAWQTMGDNGAPINRVIIEYNISFTPDIWQVAYNESVTVDDPNFECVLMSPWANYTFRVTVVNKVGPSLPSGVSKQCETPPKVPFKNPDVESKSYNKGHLVISWTPMPQIEHNGPGFFYRVTWRSSIFNLPILGKKDIKDWKQTSYAFYTPFVTAYKVEAEAHNSLGKANVEAKQY